MDESSLQELIEIYHQRFEKWPPIVAYGLSDEGYKDVLIMHLEKGSPIDESFDWYADLPPGATA